MKHFLLLFLGLTILTFACQNKTQKSLADIEKQELATGIRHDSIFMDFYLGMPKQSFFDYCWGMNKKGVFTDGSGMTVEYQLGKKNFSHPIQMNFYPQFKEDKIIEMPMKFTYEGIDLSFPNGQTQKLLVDVKKLMEEWYGNDFFITPLPKGDKGQNAYAKVSGNRRILIFSEREFEVMVLVTDLTTQ